MIVVKVGGSLLDWPGLPDRIRAEVVGRRDAVLLVGGGPFVDALRRLDPIHGLGESTSHALAMHALDLTAQVLAALDPALEVVAEGAAIESVWDRGRVPVLAPRRFLEVDDLGPDPLPHAWTTTSDSIAARLAVRLGAEELVVWKSTPIPSGIGSDLAALAELGLVDPEFPRQARGLARVRVVNARTPGGRCEQP